MSCTASASVVEGEALSVVVTDQAILDAVANGSAVVLLYHWIDYASHTDTEPALNATIGAGAVYTYVWGGVTRYRLVPSPYTYTGDAFYSAFDGSTLSGLLVSRGVA